jgi:hypothetical protein
MLGERFEQAHSFAGSPPGRDEDGKPRGGGEVVGLQGQGGAQGAFGSGPVADRQKSFPKEFMGSRKIGPFDEDGARRRDGSACRTGGQQLSRRLQLA